MSVYVVNANNCDGVKWVNSNVGWGFNNIEAFWIPDKFFHGVNGIALSARAASILEAVISLVV